MSYHLPSFVRWLSITGFWFLSLICVPTIGAQQTLENPQPDSFQSGVGVISGWSCNAQEIEISFNGRPRLKAAVRTIREDTQGVCEDTDNGFGLLYNWNRLGDGVHTVTAYADGVEFASVQVIVTTLGEEFLRGANGTVAVPDFPALGETRTLRWQQAQQNFVISAGSPQGGGTSGAAPHVLENPQPGSFQSGVGVISGWVCEAQTIEISFDGGPRVQAGTGTIREDTQSVCGDTDNGFGLLYNWNRLGDGAHTVTAYADGVEFANATVTVTTLGEEFRRGLSRVVTIPDFPDMGTDVVVEWSQAQQNFVLSFAAPTTRTVTVQPTLSLPTGVSIPNVEVTSLLSDTTVAVQAGPAPSLLLATDADGTVLLSLADMDGGFLGEGPGAVDVSINSTAVTLVALAAGYRISDIDQGIVDQITAHAQYPALLTALTQGIQANKNFLDRLMEHTEVVRLIRQVAGVRTEGAQQLSVYRAAASEPILPDGVLKTSFNTLSNTLSGMPSPWQAEAPWRWFGKTAVLPTPPFLAVADPLGSHATGNPNFVDYALEFYSDGSFQDWYYIPGNGSLFEKKLNSGAALSDFRVPAPQDYSGPPLDQVRFARYRFSKDSSRAVALSFLNTVKLLTKTAGVIIPLGVMEKWFKKLHVKAYHGVLAECGTSLATAFTPPTGTSANARTVVDWFKANMGSGFQAVTNCVTKPELGQAFRGDPRGLAKTLAGWGVEAGKKLTRWANPFGWFMIAFEAVNEVVPAFASYLAPGAGSVDYYLNWDTTNDLVRVSKSRLPPAPTNLHAERTADGNITLTWNGDQKSYRVYRWPDPRSPILAGTPTTPTSEGLEAGGHCFTVVSVNSQGMESVHSEAECGDGSDFELPYRQGIFIFLTQNKEVIIPPLPQATGGEPPYTYELCSPDGACDINEGNLLPTGLEFDPATRVLSGTPAWSNWMTGGSRYLRYRAEDSAENSVSLHMEVTVDPDPELEECEFRTVCTAGVDPEINMILPAQQAVSSDDLCMGIAVEEDAAAQMYVRDGCSLQRRHGLYLGRSSHSQHTGFCASVVRNNHYGWIGVSGQRGEEHDYTYAETRDEAEKYAQEACQTWGGLWGEPFDSEFEGRRVRQIRDDFCDPDQPWEIWVACE